MKFLFLSEKKHDEIVLFLKKRGEVDWKKEKLSKKEIAQCDWFISYAYHHIIPSQLINESKNPIINLHISYLPFNRGTHPNYWSFKDNTPKGVSIHFIDKGIDTGPILIQKECSFSKNDTLFSSYNKLKKVIEDLFYEYFNKITTQELLPKPQIGQGTFRKRSDLPTNINWQTNINKI